MSGYIPNPDDATQPTEDKIAQTAAAEFRALKNKVNNLGASGGSGSLSTGSGIQNMLMNPYMAIRLNSNAQEPTIPPANGLRTYFNDGWSIQHNLNVANLIEIASIPATSVSASDRPPGTSSYKRFKLLQAIGGPTAGQFAHIIQGIELNNIQHLSYGSVNARPTTVLLTLRSSVANLLLPCSIRNIAFNRSYVFNIQFGAANVWQRYAVNIPGDLAPSSAWVPTNAANPAAYFEFNLYAGTTLRTTTPNQWLSGNFIASSTPNSANFLTSPALSTIDVSSIEWRPGTLTSANPFELVPVGIELDNAYRYFYGTTIYVPPRGDGTNIITVQFPVYMMNNPVFTIRVGTAGDLETVAQDNRVWMGRSLTVGGFFYVEWDSQI